jgi:hypothetical protein
LNISGAALIHNRNATIINRHSSQISGTLRNPEEPGFPDFPTKEEFQNVYMNTGS